MKLPKKEKGSQKPPHTANFCILRSLYRLSYLKLTLPMIIQIPPPKPSVLVGRRGLDYGSMCSWKLSLGQQRQPLGSDHKGLFPPWLFSSVSASFCPTLPPGPSLKSASHGPNLWKCESEINLPFFKLRVSTILSP